MVAATKFVSAIQLDSWTLRSENQNAGRLLELVKFGFLGEIVLGYLIASTKLLKGCY